MSNNYSPMTPVGRDNYPKVGYVPTKIALVSWNKENGVASSILLLGHNTTEIEISPVGNVGSLVGMAGKWLTQAVVDSSVAGTSVITVTGTANFDFIVPSGTSKRFVVPIATSANYVSVQGVNRQEGLYPALAVKTLFGNASILVSEY